MNFFQPLKIGFSYLNKSSRWFNIQFIIISSSSEFGTPNGRPIGWLDQPQKRVAEFSGADRCILVPNGYPQKALVDHEGLTKRIVKFPTVPICDSDIIDASHIGDY